MGRRELHFARNLRQ